MAAVFGCPQPCVFSAIIWVLQAVGLLGSGFNETARCGYINGPSGNLMGRGVEEWADEAQHSSEKGDWADRRVPRLLVM